MTKDTMGKEQKKITTYDSDSMPSSQKVFEEKLRSEDEKEKASALDAALLLTSLASKAKVSISVQDTLIANSTVVSSRFSESSPVPTYGYKDSNKCSIQVNKVAISPMMINDGNIRIRTVSVDHSGLTCPPYESLKDYMNDHPTMVNKKKSQNTTEASAVSPPTTPKYSDLAENNSGTGVYGKGLTQKCKRPRGRPTLDPRKRFCQRKQEQTNTKLSREPKKANQASSQILGTINHMTTPNSARGLLQPKFASMLPRQRNTTILRRKFSWKNYPELEAFLIANREEYLRHSALNYTTQQKQYNNKLTERLIELASSHGYVFDKEAFSFVTVRDRIRCYYKSYVQSSKKRGLIIGYAARKAGLLTDDDLQRSARVEGRIIVPEV